MVEHGKYWFFSQRKHGFDVGNHLYQGALGPGHRCAQFPELLVGEAFRARG